MAGNAASHDGRGGLTQTGTLQIDTTAPTVSSVTATAGDYDTGKTVTLTLNMSEAATVTGTPTLTLNDGGTATYVRRLRLQCAGVQLHRGLLVRIPPRWQATAVTGTITDLAGNALSSSSLPADFCRGASIINTTGPTL